MIDNNSLRIISLLPSATEIVAALGLVDALVGRSHECDYPPAVQNLPVCTEARLSSQQPSAQIDTDVRSLLKSTLSIYQLKIEVIEQLQPTHIVTQDQCDVCAVSFPEVERAIAQLIRSQPQVISLQPNRLVEVWADIERVARAVGVDAEPVLSQLQARVDTIAQKTKTLERDRATAVALEWTEPLMGAGNWIPELIEIAGGQSLLGNFGQHSSYLRWEDLLAADPEFIIIMPCGFDLDRTQKESQVLKQHPTWSRLQAVRNGKVFITDGNAYFNRPGPRLVDSLEILAEIFHPKWFNFGYRGRGWESFQ
ncbi:MAG: cobalamin-binding protein [Hydrococcus sp. C42_A2020_068]|nr:cobalamin-binding protein [Hydrococcus sp. C42_A2020_068]